MFYRLKIHKITLNLLDIVCITTLSHLIRPIYYLVAAMLNLVNGQSSMLIPLAFLKLDMKVIPDGCLLT